jgi:hypothetical protein
MEINTYQVFCSHGQFNPFRKERGDGLDYDFFEYSTWSNQYGKGRSIEFNLIWLQLGLSYQVPAWS